MNVVIGKSTANGTVTAPPSKSYAHRLLIGAALSRGTSTIENVCLSDDIRATLDCAQTLGATVSFAETPVPQTVRVCGTGGKLLRGGEFFCRESGSTLRFFLPLALCALSENPRANAASSGKAIFRCSTRLAERGIGVYEEALKNAASFEKITENGNGAITVSGALLPGKYTIRGNVSSQFATGLLFALPLLPENSELEILPPAESESYIAVTADVLKKFGVCIEKTAQNTWFIGGNQHFSSGIFRTEGDESNAAFLKALNALGGNVIVTGLNKNSLQGDKICDTLFKQLSAGYTEADLKNCPDLAPVLFAVAAAKHGARFSGTRRLKIKESHARRTGKVRRGCNRGGKRGNRSSPALRLTCPRIRTLFARRPPHCNGSFAVMHHNRRNDFRRGNRTEKLSRFFLRSLFPRRFSPSTP